ncbi:MAG: nuclear transport factor 2 family protein [Solirubrobacteraceae bacterium]
MEAVDADVIRAGYAALNRRDVDTLLACLAEDIELHTAASGVFRGHAGILEWIGLMDRAWDPWSVELADVSAVDEHLIVEATLAGVSTVKAIQAAQVFWIVWEMRDGKAACAFHLTDRASAMRVAQNPRC